MDRVNYVIIGCGGISRAHLRGMTELWKKGYRDFRVVAVCDLVEEKARERATQLEQLTEERPDVYVDAEKMLAAHPEIDAVGVLTPHDAHHPLAQLCISQGKHVLMEKPLAITLRAARQVLEAAEKAGVILNIAENYRLAPSERAINWAVKKGFIGTPRILNWMDVGERRWYWGWRDHVNIAGGAWTIDGGVHFADLWRYHIGDVKEVFAVSRVYDAYRYADYKPIEQVKPEKDRPFQETRSLVRIDEEKLRQPIVADVEDTTSAILRFENGVTGTWVVSRSAPGRNDRSWTLYGSEGALVWHGGIYTRREAPALSWDGLIKQFRDSLSEEEEQKLFPFGITDTFAIEEKGFFDAVLGRGQVEIDGMTAYKAMAIPMAVYESAAAGRAVRLEEVENLELENYQGLINAHIGLEK